MKTQRKADNWLDLAWPVFRWRVLLILVIGVECAELNHIWSERRQIIVTSAVRLNIVLKATQVATTILSVYLCSI